MGHGLEARARLPGFSLTTAILFAGVTDPGYNAPPRSIPPQRFGVGRLRIVVRRYRIDGVDRLRHLPSDIRRHGGLLPQGVALPGKPRSKRGVARTQQIDLPRV